MLTFKFLEKHVCSHEDGGYRQRKQYTSSVLWPGHKNHVPSRQGKSISPIYKSTGDDWDKENQTVSHLLSSSLRWNSTPVFFSLIVKVLFLKHDFFIQRRTYALNFFIQIFMCIFHGKMDNLFWLQVRLCRFQNSEVWN